jgi:DNA-binding transcriptional regulator YhcF (GntR family)
MRSMIIEPEQLYTRKELAEYFKCHYNTACKVYKNILATIPKKEVKPEHHKRMPGVFVRIYVRT